MLVDNEDKGKKNILSALCLLGSLDLEEQV